MLLRLEEIDRNLVKYLGNAIQEFKGKGSGERLGVIGSRAGVSKNELYGIERGRKRTSKAPGIRGSHDAAAFKVPPPMSYVLTK